MAAAMNGMALHGDHSLFRHVPGLLRLAGLPFATALMGNRVIFVMTRDSIGLGEDGPTHQPVDTWRHCVPSRLLVFRPCDGVETAECWQLAIASSRSPSVLALTGQDLRSCGWSGRRQIDALPAPMRSCPRKKGRRCLAVRHWLGSLHRGRSAEIPARARGFRTRGIGSLL